MYVSIATSAIARRYSRSAGVADPDVVGLDRRARGEVPHCLAVRLDEVRYPPVTSNIAASASGDHSASFSSAGAVSASSIEAQYGRNGASVGDLVECP
jgi:hypothetical protein